MNIDHDAIQFWAVVLLGTKKDDVKVIAPFMSKQEAMSYTIIHYGLSDLTVLIVCTLNPDI